MSTERLRESWRKANRKYRVTEKGKVAARNNLRRYRSTLQGRCKDSLRASRISAKRIGYEPCNATWEELVAQLVLQDYCCWISGEREMDKKRLVMDHCHETGSFRGWICRHHNAGLAVYETYGKQYAEYIKENKT